MDFACQLILLCLLGIAFSDPVNAAETPVADAAEAADWAAIPQLLARHADVNAVQPDGTTALHWAVWHDHAETTALLIEHGADVNAVNQFGVTALWLACRNGHAEIVRQLLQSGADVNSRSTTGETPLLTAARTGRLAVVRQLIQHNADVHAVEHSGQDAVMWAAAEGHADVVQTLIEAGADAHRTLKSGFSAFFFAVREGRTSVVRVLLEVGTDVAGNPINSAMRPQAKDARYVRSGTSALVLAIENGHFELAAELLRRGADPNDQRSGFTPLHVLTWVRKPNSGDDLDGTPPPIGSGNMTSLELVTQLVSHGADVNARLHRGRSGRGRLNQTGATPFLLAADTADVPLMKLLLKLGADPQLPNADNCPPILAAAGIGTMAPSEEAGTEEEAIAAVQLLLEIGADIHAVDDNGETVMHGAAYKNLPDMVAFLAANGARVDVWNRKNKYGWTPLLIAEGFRPGNFKPSAATVTALHAAMRSAGVEPPPATAPRPIKSNDQYPPSPVSSPPAPAP